MNKFKFISVFLFVIVIAFSLIYFVFLNSNIKSKVDINYNDDVSSNNLSSYYIKISSVEMIEEIESLNQSDYVILDVRTKSEYDNERIPNSILISVDNIEDDVISVIPNKNIKIYIYCRSGNRSKTASYKLLDLGYKNVYDFGGIIDYPYETIKGID